MLETLLLKLFANKSIQLYEVLHGLNRHLELKLWSFILNVTLSVLNIFFCTHPPTAFFASLLYGAEFIIMLIMPSIQWLRTFSTSSFQDGFPAL